SPLAFSAIFLTQEDERLIQAKVESFSWKTTIYKSGHKNFLRLEKRGIHLVRFDLQAKTQTQVLENIFDAVATSSEKSPHSFTLICFDNAETIDNSAYSTLLQSDRQDHNFYKVVRDFCARRRLHLIMFFEEHEQSVGG